MAINYPGELYKLMGSIDEKYYTTTDSFPTYYQAFTETNTNVLTQENITIEDLTINIRKLGFLKKDNQLLEPVLFDPNELVL